MALGATVAFGADVGVEVGFGVAFGAVDGVVTVLDAALATSGMEFSRSMSSLSCVEDEEELSVQCVSLTDC